VPTTSRHLGIVKRPRRISVEKRKTKKKKIKKGEERVLSIGISDDTKKKEEKEEQV